MARLVPRGLLLSALVGVSSGGFFRGHYFIQALPPLALSGAWALGRLPRPAFAAALLVLAGAWSAGRPWMFGTSPPLVFCGSSASRFWRRWRAGRM